MPIHADSDGGTEIGAVMERECLLSELAALSDSAARRGSRQLTDFLDQIARLLVRMPRN